MLLVARNVCLVFNCWLQFGSWLGRAPRGRPRSGLSHTRSKRARPQIKAATPRHPTTTKRGVKLSLTTERDDARLRSDQKGGRRILKLRFLSFSRMRGASANHYVSIVPHCQAAPSRRPHQTYLYLRYQQQHRQEDLQPEPRGAPGLLSSRS